MRIIGKEYRVVCSQNSKNQIFIDIVPADNALHQLILQERQQRNCDTHGIAGSIKLYDMGEGNKPEILFLPPETGGLPEVEISAAEENRLRHKIIARFEEMTAQGQESTITVRPEIHQNYVNGVLANALNVIGKTVVASEQPQSFAEYRILQETKRQKHAEQTKIQVTEYLKRRDEKYGKISALQIKQLLNRDY